MTGALAWSIGGEFPLKDPNGPLFLVTRSLTAVPAGLTEKFAEGRARQLPGFKELTVTGARAVQIAAMDGIELTGTTSAQFLYQVALRDPDGGYYLLVGMGPRTDESRYLPVFREMSLTFRSK